MNSLTCLRVLVVVLGALTPMLPAQGLDFDAAPKLRLGELLGGEQSEAQIRASVSRVRSDLRSTATALECYFIDCNAYPAWAPGDSPESISFGNPLLANMPTFRRADVFQTGLGQSVAIPCTLTTPQAYLTSYFPDRFNGHRESVNTFAYYSDGSGWIIVSPGVDGVFNFDPRAVYDSAVYEPSPALLQHAYDPTNGTVSSGDIFRVRQ